MSSIELKPCPFCGSEPKGTLQTGGGIVIAIRCCECKAMGPHAASESKAIEKWNKRKEK